MAMTLEEYLCIFSRGLIKTSFAAFRQNESDQQAMLRQYQEYLEDASHPDRYADDDDNHLLNDWSNWYRYLRQMSEIESKPKNERKQALKDYFQQNPRHKFWYQEIGGSDGLRESYFEDSKKAHNALAIKLDVKKLKLDDLDAYFRLSKTEQSRIEKEGTEQLVFFEAEQLEQARIEESRRRCVPVGSAFAKTYETAKHSGKDIWTHFSEEAVRSDLPFEERMNNLMGFHMVNILTEKRIGSNSIQSADEMIRLAYPEGSSNYRFYQEHKKDELRFTDKENVDAVMEEMFRLGDRLQRNSRASAPMKEMITKLNTLKKDYRENPEKYRTMPMGKLRDLMDSVLSSADKYLQDKKDMKSFSATQKDRLKCINRLKTLRESMVDTVDVNEKAYSVGDRLQPYAKRALAEKLVMAQVMKEKGPAALCDRAKLREQVDHIAESGQFTEFIDTMHNAMKAKKGDGHTLAETYMTLMKSGGAEIAKSYETVSKARGQNAPVNAAPKAPKAEKFKNIGAAI